MNNSLEYNTERSLLIIPEYGRHLHKMIAEVVATEDREKRTRQAKAIIGIMGNMNPHLRDVPDFQHKLWDQLFIMADFDLDVDSPFEKPSKELLSQRPDPLPYPQNHPKYRFYGNNIKRMIDVANRWEEGDLKKSLVLTIANHMKKCFLGWNRDSVEDSVIFDHLFELSDGKLDLRNSGDELADFSALVRQRKKQTTSSKRGRNKKRY